MVPDFVELLLNGSVFSKIKMEKGIRQKDPLSAFVFIMYFELLSKMLLELEGEGKIHGIKIGRSSPQYLTYFWHMIFSSSVGLTLKRSEKSGIASINTVAGQDRR